MKSISFVSGTLSAISLVFAASAFAQADIPTAPLANSSKCSPSNPPMHPDPNPTTVNANPAVRITSASRELSDGDFASVSSGTSIARSIIPNGNSLPGLNTTNGLPGMTGGHGGGSGGTVSNTISRSIEQGMSPLTALSQGK